MRSEKDGIGLLAKLEKLIEKNENNMGADANCTSSHSILSQNQKRKAKCSAHRYPSS